MSATISFDNNVTVGLRVSLYLHSAVSEPAEPLIRGHARVMNTTAPKAAGPRDLFAMTVPSYLPPPALFLSLSLLLLLLSHPSHTLKPVFFPHFPFSVAAEFHSEIPLPVPPPPSLPTHASPQYAFDQLNDFHLLPASNFTPKIAREATTNTATPQTDAVNQVGPSDGGGAASHHRTGSPRQLQSVSNNNALPLTSKYTFLTRR